jgi:beta-phosphoglucomutase-like phosphatase (HAD superfamily)
MPGFEGGIFDVDGVLVDSPHERAWKDSLRELMEGDWSDIRNRTEWTDEGFTPQLYQERISGKPRMSGARAALEYFNVPDIDARIDAYADHKQAMLLRLIEAGEFEAYPDALRFVMAVRAAGTPVAAASSSKNAEAFLTRIRLDEFAAAEGLEYDFIHPGMTLLEIFDADLSGRDLAHGKPDPEIFLNAATELHVEPEQSFVVEDAPSGVQAAKAGHMAALGVARANDRALLEQADADLVVTSLDQVDLRGLQRHELRRR